MFRKFYSLTYFMFFFVLVIGKLQFKNTARFETLVECLRATIDRFHEGRTVTFLSKEFPGSIGERLLKQGIEIAIDIHTFPSGNHLTRGKMYIFQPIANDTNDHVFEIYRFIISRSEKQSFFLMIWPPNTTKSLVQNVHNIFWTNRILRVASFVPNISNDSFDIFTYFPYTEKVCGSGHQMKLVDKCSAHGFVTHFDLFSGTKKLMNFHGCNLLCFGNNLFPHSIVFREPNGTFSVRGTIVHLLETFKALYNVSLTYTNIFNDTQGWFFYNNSMQTDMGTDPGSYAFGFGWFSKLNSLSNPLIEYSFATNPECITWAIPKFAGRYIPLWTIYWIPFSPRVWLAILISVIAINKTIEVIKAVTGEKTTVIEKLDLLISIFFVITGHVQNITSNLSCMQVLMFQWCICTLVIRCAYEAHLGSLMTIPIRVEQIKSSKELLENNFTVAGGIRMYELLKSASEDNVLKSLVKRFQIIKPNEAEQMFERIYNSGKLAVLQPRLYSYFMSHRLARRRGLYSLTTTMKPCLVQTVSSSLLVQRGSYMDELINTFSQRIFETGLTRYWRKIEFRSLHRETLDKEPVSISIHKVYGVFMLLGFGLVIAFFVFSVEMILKHNFKKNKQKKKVNTMKRLDKTKISKIKRARLSFYYRRN